MQNRSKIALTRQGALKKPPRPTLDLPRAAQNLSIAPQESSQRRPGGPKAAPSSTFIPSKTSTRRLYHHPNRVRYKTQQFLCHGQEVARLNNAETAENKRPAFPPSNSSTRNLDVISVRLRAFMYEQTDFEEQTHFEFPVEHSMFVREEGRPTQAPLLFHSIALRTKGSANMDPDLFLSADLCFKSNKFLISRRRLFCEGAHIRFAFLKPSSRATTSKM